MFQKDLTEDELLYWHGYEENEKMLKQLAKEREKRQAKWQQTRNAEKHKYEAKQQAERNQQIQLAKNFVSNHPVQDDEKMAQFYLDKRNESDQNILIGYFYMKQAADKGSVSANVNMGDMALAGTVYAPNKTLAEKYKEKAAVLYIRNNNPTVQEVNKFAKEVSEDEYGEDPYLAFQLWKQVEQNNDPDTLYNIGYCLMNGKGTAQDLHLAAQYLKRAADFGSTEALYQLGILYYKLEYHSIDLNRSTRYWKIAAGNGSHLAEQMLRTVYQNTNRKIIASWIFSFGTMLVGIILLLFQKAFSAAESIGTILLILGIIITIRQFRKSKQNREVKRILQSSVQDKAGITYTIDFTKSEGDLVHKTSTAFFKPAN